MCTLSILTCKCTHFFTGTMTFNYFFAFLRREDESVRYLLLALAVLDDAKIFLKIGTHTRIIATFAVHGSIADTYTRTIKARA